MSEMSQTMQAQADDGVNLAYTVYGDGTRTVIMVHGWMVSSGVYRELMSTLNLTGLRVVVVDLRGSGRSGRPESGYTIERYGKDVLTVADALDCERFVIVGHSMGGLIAQWVSATQPARVRGQVLLCSVPPSGVPFPDEMVALFTTASGGDAGAQATILGAVTKALPEGRMSGLLAETAEISPTCLLEGFHAFSRADFVDLVSTTTAPTLVVASEDPAMPLEFLEQGIRALISGARMAFIPGAGHYVQVERPVETAAVLQAFWAGLG